MYTESVPGTKDLIEAVFVSLRDRPEDAQAYVPEMCEAITYCPDRQIATLSMLHGALYSTRDTSSFEYFVENEIAVLKNYIFEMVVTPGEGTQNVHVQNVWKERLKRHTWTQRHVPVTDGDVRPGRVWRPCGECS